MSHRVGEVCVDLVAVDEPLDGGGRVGVAGDALEGQRVARLGLRRALDADLVGGDCNEQRSSIHGNMLSITKCNDYQRMNHSLRRCERKPLIMQE